MSDSSQMGGGIGDSLRKQQN